MFLQFNKTRANKERLFELYEKVERFTPLTQDELIEFNVLINILKTDAEMINAMHKNMTDYHDEKLLQKGAK